MTEYKKTPKNAAAKIARRSMWTLSSIEKYHIAGLAVFNKLKELGHMTDIELRGRTFSYKFTPAERLEPLEGEELEERKAEAREDLLELIEVIPEVEAEAQAFIDLL